MKWIERFVVAISGLLLLVFFGCSAFQDAITPCFVEPDAVVYADANATSWMPYSSVWDAERTDRKMDYIHLVNQAAYARLLEDDNMQYNYLKEASITHIQIAREGQQMVFSPEGPIGLLFPTIFGGTLGALLIKRPGDKSKKEVEAEQK